ncbi:MAG: type IV pilus assembly protein PilM [Patescibacteria group bacterium]
MKSLLHKLFPPPQFLARPAIGLDISDRSVKFIQLKQRGNNLIPGVLGSRAIPAGIIESGRIVNSNQLKKILADLSQELGNPYVWASLPEEQAFVFQLELPNMSERELRESIELQLEEHVPLKVSEVVFDFQILSRPQDNNNRYLVNVSVLPAEMINNYLQLIKESSWQILGFEIEAQALARAFVPFGDPGVLMLVDIGRTRTSFAIIENGVVVFTSTVATMGGQNLTASVKKTLGVETTKAEELKRAGGLSRASNNKEVFYALIPAVSSLRDEISQLLDFWQTHYSRPSIDQIILAGGQSSLPGLVEYLASNTGVETVLGNPWTNVLDFNDFVPELDYNHALRYGTTIGLALRSGHLPLKLDF